MNDNAISWMMAGGSRDDAGEDRRMHDPRAAVREAAAMRESRGFGPGDLRDLVTRWNPRATPSAQVSLDCCTA